MTAEPPDDEVGNAASSSPSRDWRRILNRALLGLGRANTPEARARRWQRFRDDVAGVANALRPWM